MRKKNWKNAAISASNLSELYLTLGDVAQALNYAQQSVELADRSGDAFQRMVNRTTLADALHQAGRLSEAEAAFREAEEMQKARPARVPAPLLFAGLSLLRPAVESGQVSQRCKAARVRRWNG